MYYKNLTFAIIAFLVLHDVAHGKKSKKNKRPPVEEDESNPQPNVVAYSTFGFNDVGSNDGFVPSSPEYASFLTGVNQESTTRLYAPAFPTALEATGFGNNYGSPSFEGQSFEPTDDSDQQSSMLQYPQNSMIFFNTPTIDTSSDNVNKNTGSDETLNQNTDDENAPVYGTKIGSRNKSKPFNQFNNTNYNINNNAYPNLSDNNRYFNFPDVQPSHESKPSPGESNVHYQNGQNFAQTYTSTGVESSMKPMTSNLHNQLKFPKVVDFTNSKLYYPTAYDNNPTIPRPLSGQNYFSNIKTENSFMNPYGESSNNLIRPTPTFKNVFDSKNNVEVPEGNVKPDSFSDQSFSYNNALSHLKNNTPGPTLNLEHKRKLKKKPWISRNNHTNNFKNWKDATSLNGYEYSTNNINMSFKHGFNEAKKPPTSSNDEIEPASSNLIDLSDYKYPDTDFSGFKKIPSAQDEDDYYARLTSFQNPKIKFNDYTNSYKSLFSTPPTTTSYWGNVFKSTDYTPFKHQLKTPQFNEDLNDEVVNIPKKPHKFSYGKPLENNPNEWYYGYHSPYKSSKPLKDWNKEVSTTRYQSEEDLLGLRNHDTSHPSYLPTFNPTYNNDETDESSNNYKKLIEKWRQSYLESKYKDSVFRNYEGFATEAKPLHVPVPKPYPIEIPHPVIVPVPEPFPVRVPVSRPVAVPVIRELTIPIEKPVPYPVFKKVPYPIEKLVPVPVEKEVAVPVEKPYPVHIPYIRPVFHHTRPAHDDFESDHGKDDDYKPRPEGSNKNVHSRRRPTSRNRTRRPSRTPYQDRNRRRWPDRRRPPVSNTDIRHRRPSEDNFHSVPYKYHELESEIPDDDHSNYFSYCKRSGNC